MKGELRSIQRALRTGLAAGVASPTERYAEMLRGHDPVLEIGADAGSAGAIQALRGADPASLGAVVAIHVVERLELDPLLELLELVAARLRPGGVFIAETSHPASLVVLSRASTHDPTLTRLLHTSVFAFLCDRAGFDTVGLRYFAPPAGDKLPLITADGAPQWIDQINESLTRLNDVLFGPPEYAVVARMGQA